VDVSHAAFTATKAEVKERIEALVLAVKGNGAPIRSIESSQVMWDPLRMASLRCRLAQAWRASGVT